MTNKTQRVNENAWVTNVVSVSNQKDSDVTIDMPMEILKALKLTNDDSLLWTMLPNDLGFTVNKVQKTFKNGEV